MAGIADEQYNNNNNNNNNFISSGFPGFINVPSSTFLVELA